MTELNITENDERKIALYKTTREMIQANESLTQATPYRPAMPTVGALRELSGYDDVTGPERDGIAFEVIAALGTAAAVEGAEVFTEGASLPVIDKETGDVVGMKHPGHDVAVEKSFNKVMADSIKNLDGVESVTVEPDMSVKPLGPETDGYSRPKRQCFPTTLYHEVEPPLDVRNQQEYRDAENLGYKDLPEFPEDIKKAICERWADDGTKFNSQRGKS